MHQHPSASPQVVVPPPTAAGAHADDQPTIQLEPKKARRGLLLSAVLLACVAAGLGYYSLTLWKSDRAARAELRTTRQAVVELRTAHAESEQKGKHREQRLVETDRELAAARATLAEAQERLATLEQAKADVDADVQALREMASRFQRMIDAGKLKVIYRRGRMVVDLPAQVLFPSGSAELSDDGKKSLREVARILRGVKGKRFIVAGHTDTEKLISGAEYSSNWALSAARAVTVTESLVRYGMRADHLVAAGYGPHDPVASNHSESGRQENRRIEIILEPKVRELPERLEKRL